MRKLLKAARKEEPADLLLKGGTVANLYTMEYEKADVAIKDGVIVGVGEGYEAHEIVDCAGKIIAPGFIDGHMHVESTFMVPRSLAAVIVPLGTTTIMPDPHEIANTCGIEGVRFMHSESLGLPIDMFFGAPSCVPASHFETPKEPLFAKEIKKIFDEELCTHLGEVMNFPGVILGDLDVWAKLDTARGRIITGHAPGVTGGWLAAYLLGGITSDHECDNAAEALEKMRRGMWVMIRQGATARNLASLAPLVRDKKLPASRSMAVSDDISPDFIAARGHMDGCVRELIAEGVLPLEALRLVTLSPAEYFRLYDRGAVAPGKTADLVLLGSVEKCDVQKVWKRGKPVAEDGKLLAPITPSIKGVMPGSAVTAPMPSVRALQVKCPDNSKTGVKINVIGAIRDQVATKKLVIEATVKDGFAVADSGSDLAKIAVVEKNQGTGRTAVGFIQGYGLGRGAIASSIAHDAHNFVCVGMDDLSMVTALNKLKEIGGGIALALDRDILATLELPAGGLMSPLQFDELRVEIAKLREALKELRADNPDALMQLSFMSLSVIPELKLTDKGYFDISGGGEQPLFVK